MFERTPYLAVNVPGVWLDGFLVSEAVDDVEGVADVAADQFHAVEPSMSRSSTPVGYKPWKIVDKDM